MAKRSITEGSTSWNNKIPLPKDRRTLRCIEESFGLSQSSGNPMITRTWEIVEPNEIEIGDRKVDIDGVKVTQYLPTKNKEDAEKSNKAFGRLVEDLKSLGYSESEIDDENPPLIAKGKVVDAIVYGKENKSFKPPTAEEKKNGARFGQPIKDAQGKDVVVYQPQIETILGLSTVEVNRPY